MLVTTAPTLTPQGPNDGLPSFGPNKYYFMYIFVLFIIFIYINIYNI